MNHSQILKRGWSILWSYRTLWVFGFLIALTGPSSNSSSNFRYAFDETDLRGTNIAPEIREGLQELNDLINVTWNLDEVRTVITVIAVAILISLLIGVSLGILRYVSRTAMIRMVNQYEDTGEKVNWRTGFRMGWSKEAWHLFLVDLAVYLPVILVIMVLFGCAATPILVSEFSGRLPTWSGVIATIGLVFLLIFLIVLIITALSLVMEFMYRVVVLQGTGVLEGIRLGWQLVIKNFKDVFVLWLILIGIQFGFLILVIPLVFMALGVGVFIGGAIGYGLFFVARNLWGQPAGWITALIAGGGMFMLVMIFPLTFVGGLKETYLSSVWTLAYRSVIQIPGLGASEVLEEGAQLKE